MSRGNDSFHDLPSKKYKILCIDGGGIRGLIPAKVLEDLEAELKKNKPGSLLRDHFDMVCGTSTGAILAAGISLGIPAKELVKFYRENARNIFPIWRVKVVPRWSYRWIKVFIRPVYSNKAIRQKLIEVFTTANGNVTPTLGDIKNIAVCIPTFNGVDGKVNVLKTRHLEEYKRDYRIPLHDAVLCSASAPLFFPPHTFSYKHDDGDGTHVNMIDGGIFANNPSLIGLLEASDKLGVKFEDITLLSLGTGKSKNVVQKSWIGKGITYWISKARLLDVILTSQAQITEEYVNFMKRMAAKQNGGKGFRYLRVQAELDSKGISLNASKKKHLDRLESVGQELSKNYINQILKLLK